MLKGYSNKYSTSKAILRRGAALRMVGGTEALIILSVQ